MTRPGAATLLALAFLPLALVAAAQTDAPMVESEDSRYFDFWVGTWAEVVDGKPDLAAKTGPLFAD